MSKVNMILNRIYEIELKRREVSEMLKDPDLEISEGEADFIYVMLMDIELSSANLYSLVKNLKVSHETPKLKEKNVC